MVISPPRWSLEHPFDEQGEPVVVCPECEGTGKGDGEEFDPDFDPLEAEDEGPSAYCSVCCGFGRLDW